MHIIYYHLKVTTNKYAIEIKLYLLKHIIVSLPKCYSNVYRQLNNYIMYSELIIFK